MIKILLVDDHAIVRRGIVNIISSEKDMAVIAEASGYNELIGLLPTVQFDIIILDITLPDGNGLDAIIELKSIYPDMRIIVLSMHKDEEIIRRAFKTGCSAYLNKDSVPEELIRAIRIVHGGSKYIGSSLAANLKYENNDETLPHEKLSSREFQIFCLIVAGNSLTDIAKKLNISVKTVGTYRSRIMDKMKLKSNIELTHYAIKNKIVTNFLTSSANSVLV